MDKVLYIDVRSCEYKKVRCMILDKTLLVKIIPANKKYWIEKGYQVTNIGDSLKISTSDLPGNSNRMIRCQCNMCKRHYTQRFSRNTDICGYCLSSNRMKGNKLGELSGKILSPGKDILEEQIRDKMTKSDMARHHGVSITTINRWLNESGITLTKYHGRRYIKSEEHKLDILEKIKNTHNDATGLSELSRLVGIPRHILKNLSKSGDIDQIKTQFDVWSEAYSKILNNLNYYIEENKTKNLKIISEENSISIEQLKKAFRENNIDVRLHSYNKSKGEMECSEFIESLGEECHSAMLYKIYEIDCYVPKKNFGVEYCGEYWHRYDENKQNKYYHRNKMRYAKEKGISLLTIFESEWLLKNDIVKSIIRNKLGQSKKIHARKTVCRSIGKTMAETFHENNHISGHTNSSINLGLFHGETLVSVLSLIKSRFDKNYQYEISRFSSLQNHVVVGGLSKLFDHFVKIYNPQSCMTYSDLRIGEGKSYEKIGFKYIGETVPNYYYYHKKKGYLEPRMRYQKHKLKSLPSYSPEKTEHEIMTDEGYYIVYDCGNKKYGWTR